MTYKGRFTPQNPKKYNGNSDNIIYRSSWELRVMKYLDENQDDEQKFQSAKIEGFEDRFK